MTEHPITPPPELVDKWFNEWYWYNSKPPGGPLQYTATQAARWGADQELEACAEWVKYTHADDMTPDALRAARRPKPPSLKQQALDGLRTIECNIPQSQRAFEDSCEHIRRALEALPDD